MTLQERMLADVSRVFLNSKYFSRQIKYTPAGGAARYIQALVWISEQIETVLTEDGEQEIQRGKVWGSQDATAGVSSLQLEDRFEDLVSAGDTIKWAPDKGAKGEYGLNGIDLVRNVTIRKSNHERIDRAM